MTPSRIGSDWWDANRVLNALTTRASGSRTASSSAFDVLVSISAPLAPNDIRLVTSTTGFPAMAGRMFRATAAALANGIARTTRSADSAAARGDGAVVARLTVAARSLACCGSRDVITSS